MPFDGTDYQPWRGQPDFQAYPDFGWLRTLGEMGLQFIGFVAASVAGAFVAGAIDGFPPPSPIPLAGEEFQGGGSILAHVAANAVFWPLFGAFHWWRFRVLFPSIED